MLRSLASALTCVLALGCITIVNVPVSQKTTLERQLMGEFEPLSENEILAMSIRAEGGLGAGSLDDLRQAALRARRRQLFNRDDLDELKATGCVGENTQALLTVRPCDAEPPSPEAARLLEEENEDRRAIIAWALAADPVLTSADRDQVVRVYALLLREQATPEHWFQLEDGAWRRKSELP